MPAGECCEDVDFITSANTAKVIWSFCHSVNRMTDEWGNGPNLAGMGKGWLSRSCQHLVVIRRCVWIRDDFFIVFTIVEWGIFGHLLAFLIQSMADLYRTWRNDADKICIHNILGQIWRTSRSGLIRISGFESRITFVSNFGVGGGLSYLSALVFVFIVDLLVQSTSVFDIYMIMICSLYSAVTNALPVVIVSRRLMSIVYVIR